jgi:hypothetical protein
MFKKWLYRMMDVAMGFVAGLIVALGWKRKRPIVITRRTVNRMYGRLE